MGNNTRYQLSNVMLRFMALFALLIFVTANQSFASVKINNEYLNLMKCRNSNILQIEPAIPDNQLKLMFDGKEETHATLNGNPLVMTFSMKESIEITFFKVMFGADPSYTWQIEAAETIADLEGKTRSYKLVSAPRLTIGNRWEEVELPEPVVSKYIRVTVERAGGAKEVIISEFQVKANFAQLEVLPINIGSEIQKNQAKLEANGFDIASAGKVFDRSEDTFASSLTPGSVTYISNKARKISGFQTLFKGNTLNNWYVESADNLEDLNAKKGSYFRLVGDVQTGGGRIDKQILPTTITAKVFRLNFSPATEGVPVELSEWVVLEESGQWKVLRGPALWITISVIIVLSLVVVWLITLIPQRFRRTIITVIVFTSGLFYSIEYFWPADPVTQENFLTNYIPTLVNPLLQIIGGLLLGVGLYSITSLHFHNVRRKRQGWGASLSLLVAVITMAIVGFWQNNMPTTGMHKWNGTLDSFTLKSPAGEPQTSKLTFTFKQNGNDITGNATLFSDGKYYSSPLTGKKNYEKYAIQTNFEGYKNLKFNLEYYENDVTGYYTDENDDRGTIAMSTSEYVTTDGKWIGTYKADSGSGAGDLQFDIKTVNGIESGVINAKINGKPYKGKITAIVAGGEAKIDSNNLLIDYERKIDLQNTQGTQVKYDVTFDGYPKMRFESRVIGSSMDGQFYRDWRFSADEIKDAQILVKRLIASQDPASTDKIASYTWSLLPAEVKKELTDKAALPNNELAPLAASALNIVLAKDGFYDDEIFTNSILNQEAIELLDKDAIGNDLNRVNRRLLEQAFAVEVARSPYANNDAGTGKVEAKKPARMAYFALFDGLLQNFDAAMFSLIAFYILSAAYRAFRLRSIEASILMGSALVVILGLSFGSMLTGSIGSTGFASNFRIEAWTAWLLNVISAPALRAIGFGIGVGSLAMSLRLWLSIERGAIFGD